MTSHYIVILILSVSLLSSSLTKASVEHKSSLDLLEQQVRQAGSSHPVKNNSALIFDIPVTYNLEVKRWIRYFQTDGKGMFRKWLEKSSRYFPMIQKELAQAGLPRDLSYMVMIESGFSSQAHSIADAIGPWQFIESTGKRYGLQSTWWLDERRDLYKSTRAAVRYMRDLYTEFESWYLVAASYNMGENGLRRLIRKNKTKDYWKLVSNQSLPQETREYVPKLLAAMLIAKAPGLYGFRDIDSQDPMRYQMIDVPGGTTLDAIADYIGVTRQAMRDINAELRHSAIPRNVAFHRIRIPVGSYAMTKKYVSYLSSKVAEL